MTVSVVIPAYNPERWLLDAIDSVHRQTHQASEILVVDDGTTTSGGKDVLRAAAQLVTHVIEQPNLGLPAARNTGFRNASGDYVSPLDCDDLLEPGFLDACVRVLEQRPDAAFAYTDYRFFGEENYVQRCPEYNLYELLDANPLPYACVMRKDAWERVGGYDESFRPGYEDWEFWLRLGARGLFGCRVPQPLFRYRKHGRSLIDAARERHAELVAAIQASHPELYSDDGRAAIKTTWKPAVCVVGQIAPDCQTIRDYQVADSIQGAKGSNAAAFLVAEGRGAASFAGEHAALAVWGGNDSVKLADGSIAMSRRVVFGGVAAIAEQAGVRPGRASPLSPRIETIRRHLANAGLDSLSAWTRHPVRSAVRAIPLRVKEAVNRTVGRPAFDLSFYLQFQPRSVLLSGIPVERLEYIPQPTTKRRIAFITPHLGRGGAESVLLSVAQACDRGSYEISVLATHPGDRSWTERWRDCADWVYDLPALVPPERVAGAVYSIAANWQFDFIVLQNSLHAYSVAGAVKKTIPRTRIIDIVHAATTAGWDLIGATTEAIPFIDVRVGISAAVCDRLLAAGTPAKQVRLIRNGIDLDRFAPVPLPPGDTLRILFAGRLERVKRPLLLADIARALRAHTQNFLIQVAGAGPEDPLLRRRVERLKVGGHFEFLGHVEDMAPVIAACDVLLLTSEVEGIPLAVLEAMACARPVVASEAGAIGEAVDQSTGALIAQGQSEAERFAAAIALVAANRAKLAQLGAAGRKRVEAEYDRLHMLRAYAALFDGGQLRARSD